MKVRNLPIRAALFQALLSLGAAGAPGAAIAGEDAVYIRLSQDAGATRVEVGLNARAAFQVFALDEPPRVVVDFKGVAWAAEAPLAGDALRLVEGVRIGAARRGDARMVVDLRGPARIAAAFTETTAGAAPARFVLELAPTDAADFAARAAATPAALPPPPDASAARAGVLVMIDPGHGGRDPGASADGVLEKDLVLSYARAVAARIRALPGHRAALTRDDDGFLSLRDRVRAARDANADLLISLHADALEKGVASGASVYTLSAEASDDVAAELSASHDRADAVAGVRLEGEGDDVARVLVDLSRRRTDARSLDLAGRVVDALAARTEVLAGRALQSAGFRVLKAPDVPSILIELGFMSSARDRARLTDPAGRAAVADAIAQAVAAWTAADPALAARAAKLIAQK